MTRQPTLDRRGHWSVGADFRPGAPFLAAVPISVVVPTAGANRLRLRFKTTGNGGTLVFQFVRPDESDTPYTGSQPVDQTVTAGTELVVDINPHYGEGLLKLTFTPAGNGSVVFCDVSQH